MTKIFIFATTRLLNDLCNNCNSNAYFKHLQINNRVGLFQTSDKRKFNVTTRLLKTSEIKVKSMETTLIIV